MDDDPLTNTVTGWDGSLTDEQGVRAIEPRSYGPYEGPGLNLTPFYKWVILEDGDGYQVLVAYRPGHAPVSSPSPDECQDGAAACQTHGALEHTRDGWLCRQGRVVFEFGCPFGTRTKSAILHVSESAASPSVPVEIEVCLGCGKPTAERDCGCPAGTGMRAASPSGPVENEPRVIVNPLHEAGKQAVASLQTLLKAAGLVPSVPVERTTTEEDIGQAVMEAIAAEPDWCVCGHRAMVHRLSIDEPPGCEECGCEEYQDIREAPFCNARDGRRQPKHAPSCASRLILDCDCGAESPSVPEGGESAQPDKAFHELMTHKTDEEE